VIETYIFDLDDTIIDSSIYARMYNELINELISNLDISEIELQKIITKLKQETGKSKPDTYELCKKLNATEIYYKVLEKYVHHTYTLKTKEIPKVFRKIKEAGKKIGIVSSSKQRTIKIWLERFNLSDYVDFIFSGDKKTVLFWITLERKNKIKKEDSLVIDNSDECLEIAKHTGYNILNVKNLDTLEGFNY